MLKQTVLKCGIAIALACLFLLIFSLLQDPKIYNSTLGKISDNYTHLGNDKKFQIVPEKKPFEKITAVNCYRWDAILFKDVKDHWYSGTDKQFKERLDYYPLYPLVWKLTSLDSPFIFLFSYLL